MIFDRLKNAKLYYPFGENFEKAFNYLINTNFSNIEPGKYEIDGENVFALVQEYNTKPFSAGKWESHRKYIDVQYIFEGKEKMGFTESTKVIVMEEYNDDKDYAIYKGEGNFIIAEEGHFAVFFPTDIHMPSMALNIPREVKKVVVKIKTDYVGEEIKPVVEENETAVDELKPVEDVTPPQENNPTEETSQ